MGIPGSCLGSSSGCCLCHGKESWKSRQRREGRKRRKRGSEGSLLDRGTNDDDLQSWYSLGRKDNGCYGDLALTMLWLREEQRKERAMERNQSLIRAKERVKISAHPWTNLKQWQWRNMQVKSVCFKSWGGWTVI